MKKFKQILVLTIMILVPIYVAWYTIGSSRDVLNSKVYSLWLTKQNKPDISFVPPIQQLISSPDPWRYITPTLVFGGSLIAIIELTGYFALRELNRKRDEP